MAMQRLARPIVLRAALLVAALSATVAFATDVNAAGKPPSLVVTNDPLPAELQDRLYSRPQRVPDITRERVIGNSYFDDGETVVGRRIGALRNDLFSLQGTVSDLSERLASIQNQSQNQSSEYFANVATISTQLQSGTTPGNPRLIKRLAVARNSLEGLATNVASLNDLAIEISNAASLSGFLLESARATYSLSGAIEEDHSRLAQLEDSINNTVVAIERLENNVNDDISRTVTYLSTERNNLRTLSLAITTGDLFGKSLSNRPFSSAQPANFASGGMAVDGMAAPQAGAPGTPRPLVKIRFDKANVAYEQPVYLAINEALQRFPNARFELVAVHPSGGNNAETTIESTRARRNAEKVLRTLTQMGLTMDRVDLSYLPSAEATTSEVHLYIR